jgi:hypothetical protein
VHFVYRLRFEESRLAAGPGATVGERHEFWAASAPDLEPALQAWRARRINEDAGTGAARARVRDAIARMYGHGILLRHIVERRQGGAAGNASEEPAERIVRAITEISRDAIPMEIFRKPTGLADTEFLAPAPDTAGHPAAGRESPDAPDNGRAPTQGDAPPGE